jgi:hypothetical protein
MEVRYPRSGQKTTRVSRSGERNRERESCCGRRTVTVRLGWNRGVDTGHANRGAIPRPGSGAGMRRPGFFNCVLRQEGNTGARIDPGSREVEKPANAPRKMVARNVSSTKGCTLSPPNYRQNSLASPVSHPERSFRSSEHTRIAPHALQPGCGWKRRAWSGCAARGS